MQEFWLTMADDQFYVPLEQTAAVGARYEPAEMPADWRRRSSGIWTYWDAKGVRPVAQGWKVHVSTTLESLQDTLDTVARACVAERVPFKHIASELFFRSLHHKHASRVQAGKFCAAYPSDVETSRALMDRLADELGDAVGPYVLTDRRYGERGVVFYRYGAYASRDRLLLDGTREPLIRDADGRDVPDRRLPSFTPPPGVTDPFAPEGVTAHTGPVVLNGRFEVLEAIRHSNGGGTYKARDLRDGAEVFVKEARPHTGLDWDGQDTMDRLRREYAALRDIDARDPGLCPAPVDYFSQGEHEFLVTELVAGGTPLTWVARNGVLYRHDAGDQARADHLARAGRILASLREALDRLHGIGMRFGDLSHGNVLVAEDDTVRLIDFETANPVSEPPIRMGTPGYVPPKPLADAGITSDEYGFAALAMLLLFPMPRPLELDPRGRLALLRRDLEGTPPIPEEHWRQATRYYGRLAESGDDDRCPVELPTAAELDERPAECLARLMDGVTRGLLAMARPDRQDWLFPPPSAGYAVNTHCLAHGTAGVLHALHQAGAEIPAELVTRFSRDVAAHAPRLPPGLQAGTAGLALVLAELGKPEQAAELLGPTRVHALAGESAELGNGAAGIGMAHLALYARGGEHGLLDHAARIADGMLADDLAAVIEHAGTPGLESGLSGVALFLHCLAAHTGEDRYTAAAVHLMHAELDRSSTSDTGDLQFTDVGGQRVISYLTIGSAGVATALTRLVAATGDERCRAALPDVLAGCRAAVSVEPGLYTGVASWAFAFAEHADHAGGQADHATAVRIATGLAKYAIRRPEGLWMCGSFDQRFHADLGSGGAGVLLALARVLHGAGVELFTADRPAAPAGAIPRPVLVTV